MDETEYERLLGSAIRFVSFRPRSEKELRDYCSRTLKKHHTTAPIVVNRVMARLTDLGYVDDRKFVEWWVEQRTAFRPKGKRAIFIELQKKGISRQIIDTYISERKDSVNEYELAQKAILRKLVIWQHIPQEIQKKKIYDFLSRRGFDTDTIASIVDDATGKE